MSFCPERFAFACQSERRRQIARNLAGETRPRQHRDFRFRQDLFHDLAHKLARVLLDPFRADHDRLSGFEMRRNFLGDRPHELGRDDEQDQIRIGKVFHLRGCLDGRIEGGAGKVDPVGVMGIDFGNRFGFKGPKRDVPSGAERGLRQRRSPRAAAQDAHALKRARLAMLQVSVHDLEPPSDACASLLHDFAAGLTPDRSLW